MFPKNRGSVIALFFAAVLSAGSFGCGGSTSAPPPSIKVSLPNATATVEVGATAQFTATVTNDAANKGVNWSLLCSAPACGSVSPASTASGSPTTYTPPASQSSELSVTLTATSVSDGTKSAVVTVTVPAIAISLSLTS